MVARLLIAALASVVAAGLPAPAAAEDTVQWHGDWPKVGAPELVLGGGAVLGAAFMRYVPGPPHGRMHGGILFDHFCRRGLRYATDQGRAFAGNTSDVLWYAAMAWPMLLDPALALLVHRDGEVAGQLSWIAFETLALAALISTSTENLGRQRPRAIDCHDVPEDADYCSAGEANRSFMSGHVLASFAGAGVVCAAHQSLGLYGGGAGDVAACAGALTVATSVAVLRVVSDNHWASDVIFSGGIGFVVGYILPKLLHFGFGDRASPAAARREALSDDHVTAFMLTL